jgi:arginyl-tRNA synthetase
MSQLKIAELVSQALANLGIVQPLDYRIELAPRRELGDYASNIGILVGRLLKRNPVEVAEQIAKECLNLDQGNVCSRIEFAKPGFVNFFLNDGYLQNNLWLILEQDEKWGELASSKRERILLEFVSANPTGPLHVGHGRWAVIGDNIGRLLKAAGYQLETEFYINNVGAQVDRLEASVRARRAGNEVPEGGYGGEYIKEVQGETREEMLGFLLSQQRATLDQLGVKFDNWYQESSLHEKDKIGLAVQKLHDLNVTFEEGGAIWFKSSALGDDKNRVLVREDKRPTYFAADIAYHLEKYERGFDRLIDLWGTDHHGYVGRLKAALKVLGQPVDCFEIIIGQLVSLYRGNEQVRMSKRTGEMITLQEVIDEIGVDATRFFFSATDVNSHLDFDLELAKKQSNDNPVFYVQYAHARICSILKKSQLQTSKSKTNPNIQLTNLKEEAEKRLMLKLLTWPEVVAAAAELRHPHRITEYGKELATEFHHFYEHCRVLGDPARELLVEATRITLRNVLELLGISAPEEM